MQEEDKKSEGSQKILQKTEETGSASMTCYRCQKPLDDDVEIKGICEDCFKLESIEVQRAFRKLKEADTNMARLHYSTGNG